MALKVTFNCKAGYMNSFLHFSWIMKNVISYNKNKESAIIFDISMSSYMKKI